MTLDELTPALQTWDDLNMAINAFTVVRADAITRAASRLSSARARMASQDLPESVAPAWSALQVSIGAALVSAPHELSASIERMEQRRENMRTAIWNLSTQLTPEQERTVSVLAAAVLGVDSQKPSRRSRR
jgi:hypothetical protein